jgi:thiol-disulfide isomerase/thioredoxin
MKTRLVLMLALIAGFFSIGNTQELPKSKKSEKAADSTTYALSAQDANGQTNLTFNKQKKLNMLVFWASWCKPCRMEIPELKTLASKYKDENFYITNISLDKDKLAWENALREENMEWDQFIVAEEDKEKFNRAYDTRAIPLVVFTDESGKVLSRIVGYSQTNITQYDLEIRSQLRKQKKKLTKAEKH